LTLNARLLAVALRIHVDIKDTGAWRERRCGEGSLRAAVAVELRAGGAQGSTGDIDSLSVD